MNVLQLLQRPQRRGAEVFGIQLANSLSRREFGCAAVFWQGDGRLDVAGLDTSEATSAHEDQLHLNGESRGGVSRLAALAAAFRADIVQANGGDTVKWAALAAWRSPRRRWSLIYRNIGDPSVWLINPLRRAFYRHLVWPKIDGVVSVSEQSKAGLRGVYGDKGPPIAVIYQGVDDQMLEPGRPRRAAWGPGRPIRPTRCCADSDAPVRARRRSEGRGPRPRKSDSP